MLQEPSSNASGCDPAAADRPCNFGEANVVQALDAFYREHRLCGDLEGGVTPATERRQDIPDDVQWVAWMGCPVCEVRCEVTRERQRRVQG